MKVQDLIERLQAMPQDADVDVVKFETAVADWVKEPVDVFLDHTDGRVAIRID